MVRVEYEGRNRLVRSIRHKETPRRQVIACLRDLTGREQDLPVGTEGTGNVVMAIRSGGRGDVTETHIAWREPPFTRGAFVSDDRTMP